MRKIIILILWICAPLTASADVWVNGYYRADGTYVRGHYRTDPDGFLYNNYSYDNTSPTYVQSPVINKERSPECDDVEKSLTETKNEIARVSELLKIERDSRGNGALGVIAGRITESESDNMNLLSRLYSQQTIKNNEWLRKCIVYEPITTENTEGIDEFMKSYNGMVIKKMREAEKMKDFTGALNYTKSLYASTEQQKIAQENLIISYSCSIKGGIYDGKTCTILKTQKCAKGEIKRQGKCIKIIRKK